MRIAGLSSVMQQSLLAALPKVADAFSAAAGTDGAKTAAAVPQAIAPPATSVEMLVALAAAEPAIERRRKLAEQADRGLLLLERLHAALVAGAVRPEQIEELVEWSETLDAPQDPQLASLAREIEVRVRVELAKHERRL